MCDEWIYNSEYIASEICRLCSLFVKSGEKKIWFMNVWVHFIEMTELVFTVLIRVRNNYNPAMYFKH